MLFRSADHEVDDGYELTAPVGSYPAGASPYGVLDMAGNVWEWVQDGYDAGYYDGSPSVNPAGSASDELKVVRGGAWFSNMQKVRSALRNWFPPAFRINMVGFRCASIP